MTSATGSKNSAGVTLVELILVMALLLTILAMVAPRLGAFSRERVLISEGDVVLAMLHTARDRSAAEAATYRFQVESDGAACRLYRQTGGRFESLPDRPDGLHLLPQETRIRIERTDGGDAEFIEFRPTGECTPSSVYVTRDDEAPVVVRARTPLEAYRLIEPGQEGRP